MMRCLLILLAVPLFLSGCVMESRNPLSPRSSAVRDSRLEGLWRGNFPKDDSTNSKEVTGYVYAAYGRGGDGSIVILGKDEKGTQTMSLDFFVTRTAKREYLNLTNAVTRQNETVQGESSKNYIFAECHFDWDGRLVVSLAEFSKAIQAGKLEGTKEGDETVVQSPSEKILGYIESAKPGDVLFKYVTLTRIGGP